MIFVQLIVGATMRHEHAGLAIPDFPRAHGRWWPAMDDAAIAKYNRDRIEVKSLNPITAFHVGLHMAHRLIAVVITLAVAGIAFLAVRRWGGGDGWTRLALLWAGVTLVGVIRPPGAAAPAAA